MPYNALTDGKKPMERPNISASYSNTGLLKKICYVETKDLCLLPTGFLLRKYAFCACRNWSEKRVSIGA